MLKAGFGCPDILRGMSAQAIAKDELLKTSQLGHSKPKAKNLAGKRVAGL
ncbi:hypothetical protein MJK71_20695 [Escherichia coli]|nr:hypothetical protein MJK71_20695 [Escherichia coli]